MERSELKVVTDWEERCVETFVSYGNITGREKNLTECDVPGLVTGKVTFRKGPNRVM